MTSWLLHVFHMLPMLIKSSLSGILVLFAKYFDILAVRNAINGFMTLSSLIADQFVCSTLSLYSIVGFFTTINYLRPATN